MVVLHNEKFRQYTEAWNAHTSSQCSYLTLYLYLPHIMHKKPTNLRNVVLELKKNTWVWLKLILITKGGDVTADTDTNSNYQLDGLHLQLARTSIAPAAATYSVKSEKGIMITSQLVNDRLLFINSIFHTSSQY